MYNALLENILLQLGDVINNSSYIKQLRYWREVDTYSEQELAELQEDNLKHVLTHAIQNVPFYRDIEKKGNDVVSLLAQFPIIDKHHLRNQKEQFIARNYQDKDLVPYSSSGSSGIQTTVYMTKEEQSIIRGILTHWWEWSGYKIGDPIVQTGITPKRGVLKSIKDVLYRTIYLNAFSHTEEQLKEVCIKIASSPNTFYAAGYASSLHVLAEYATKHNYDIHLKGIISLGDKMFAHYRKHIEKTCKAKVFDTYGTNEGLMIAAQNDLEYYYILSPHVYIEIVDDAHRPVADGQMGHVVVTRLDNYSMPLIRYKVGDLAVKLPKDQYPKERKYQYPLLKTVIGRETDIVILPNGSKMVVHSFTGVFEYLPEIKQFKVVQEDLSGIVIEYVKSEKFTNTTLEKAKRELTKYIQEDTFSIVFREVKTIAPTKSGKPQIIESRLKK